MKPHEVLIVRRDAAQDTLNTFLGHPIEWGKADCVRMAAHALRELGYKPRLSRGGYYKNPLGARRALKRAGFDTLEAALDDLGLRRVPAAYALPGDIIALPGNGDWPALGVWLGNGAALAINMLSNTCDVCRPAAADILTVWSAPPCKK